MAGNNTPIWVVGYHAINALLQTNPERALEFYYVAKTSRQNQFSLVQQFAELGVITKSTDKPTLTKRCGSEHHQGVALLAKQRKEGDEKQLLQSLKSVLASDNSPLLLILDQVQDPHNFGACLRTAEAAGVDGVIVAKDNASPITPTVQKVASGAVETVDIYRVTNLARTMQALQRAGVWIVGTSDRAIKSLYQQDLTAPLALVMGAEGGGMRQLTKKNCDELVRLPMAGTVVSSLNVSVATGVCLFEIVRQRTF